MNKGTRVVNQRHESPKKVRMPPSRILGLESFMERRKSVLVLDFDDDVLIALERALEDSGFNTTATWDVDEALALLRQRHFDFLVLGNRPPRLDAQAIVANARKEGLKFETFVLPRAHASEDGYTHLIDRIRNFPGCPERPKKTVQREAVA